MPVTTPEREDVVHHGLPVAEVVLLAEADSGAGLSTVQWRQRLARFGPNELPAHRGPGWVVRLLGQLHHPLIYVLLAAATITAALGEVVDASVVFGVVVVNAIIGFVQEARAERALDALTAMVRTEVTVVRDGLTARVPSAELVPGDLVVLEAGDQVGADFRLLSTKELHVDESALTGESVPVTKNPVSLSRPARTPIVSAILLAWSFGAFRWQLSSGASLEFARTVAVNVFVGAQIAYLSHCRSLERFRPSTGPNRWLLVGVALTVGLQLLLTYAPFMNTLFHTAPLGWQAWLVVVALSAVSYVLVELEKWRQRRGRVA